MQPTMSSAAATSSAHATIVNGLSEEDKQASPWRLFPPGHNPNQYNAQTPGPCTPAHSARPRAQATIKLFKAYDDDGNGELDFDEFKQVRGRLWFATGCGGFAGAGVGVCVYVCRLQAIACNQSHPGGMRPLPIGSRTPQPRYQLDLGVERGSGHRSALGLLRALRSRQMG